jgi:glutamyl-tRNA synthetase
MTDSRIRTRFAPSPTGPLHIGGLRTALYSFLFARKHQGDFILRIEDTDRQRLVPGAEEYIVESLRWCGIVPDEGITVGGPFAPYRQSERLAIYQRYARQLIEQGHAYYAFDTAEELEQLRHQAEVRHQAFSYDATVRMQLKNSLRLSPDETQHYLRNNVPFVIRLKIPPEETIILHDLVRGQVLFSSNLIDDKVLIKADGTPTYHLAHVVDDIEMKITHVIRGEEWLPSAPAHVLIYRFLNREDTMPQFAHLPLLLRPDGHGKLSKRDSDQSGFPIFPIQWKDPATGEIIDGYREQGYYPEALVNMLALLGWNPGNEQEIFSMDELIAAFSFEHVHKAGARFDPEKVRWINSRWLQRKPLEHLAQSLKKQLNENNWMNEQYDDHYCLKAAALLRPRVHFEHELAQTGKYLFCEPNSWDTDLIARKWKDSYRSFFRQFIDEYLMSCETLEAASVERAFKDLAARQQIKAGEVLPLLRIFLTGTTSGVELFPMMELLGHQTVINRLNRALEKV